MDILFMLLCFRSEDGDNVDGGDPQLKRREPPFVERLPRWLWMGFVRVRVCRYTCVRAHMCVFSLCPHIGPGR